MKKSVQKILAEQVLRLTPDKKAYAELSILTKEFVSALNATMRSMRVKAESFVGGSFARGTFLRSDIYDVDIFVRFDPKYDEISSSLEKILKVVCKKMSLRLEKIHGSRDYFRVHSNKHPGYFEIIPVTKIKKPQEERNVTDLSYFHVPYVKKHIRRLEDQVRLAKQFFKAHNVYGAETYVRGFSGYAIELLTIYYKSFLNMLKGLAKIQDRTVIDIAKHYKRPNDVFINLNEAKLHSPIILIDPTYKERNALAALSHETLVKLQKAAQAFLKKPSSGFFDRKEIDKSTLEEKARKKKIEFVSIVIETDKQDGDIAGTKLRKFYDFLLAEIKHYFIISEDYFIYKRKHDATAYIILKAKKEIIRIGPPMHMKKHVTRFKQEHINTYVKGKFIHAKIPITFNARSYIDTWAKANSKTLNEMHITALSIC